MRTFISIELPQSIKDFLSRIQGQLKSSQADVKWVAPKNIHLTLKFLGEIGEKKIDKINTIIEDAAKNINSFYIRISSLGAFPGINSPRVIWVGIDKGDNEIKEIAKGLEEKIAKLGIPKEGRAFSSHITIGRVRSGLNRERLSQYLKTLGDKFGSGEEKPEFLADSITLFKSTLAPGGPIYETLKEAAFKTI